MLEGDEVNDFNIETAEDIGDGRDPLEALASERMVSATTAAETSVSDEEEARRRIRASTTCMESRARMMVREKLLNYPIVDIKFSKGGPQSQPEAFEVIKICDENIIYAMKCLFGSDPAAPGTPFFDLFSARYIDHKRRAIPGKCDEWSNCDDLFAALRIMGLPALKFSQVYKGVLHVADKCRGDSLVMALDNAIPAWDGVPRMDYWLRDLYKCHDTPFTRAISRVTVLELYNRMVYGGVADVEASICLVLIGAQHAGKTALGNIWSKEITGRLNIDTGSGMFGHESVILDLSGRDSKTRFLRAITGNSPIAMIDELANYTKADKEEFKSFISLMADELDRKYLDSRQVRRRWSIIGNGNKDQHLNNDETGNRRFAVIYCGEITLDEMVDRGLNQRCDPEFRADFHNVVVNGASLCREGDNVSAALGMKRLIWMLLAECRAYMNGVDVYEDNFGENFDFIGNGEGGIKFKTLEYEADLLGQPRWGKDAIEEIASKSGFSPWPECRQRYGVFFKKAAACTSHHNKKRVEKAEGISPDYVLDEYFVQALEVVPVAFFSNKTFSGAALKSRDLAKALRKCCGHQKFNSRRIGDYLIKSGFAYKSIKIGGSAAYYYYLDGCSGETPEECRDKWKRELGRISMLLDASALGHDKNMEVIDVSSEPGAIYTIDPGLEGGF